MYVPCVFVRVDDAEVAVLNGHVPAGKLNHLPATRHVHLMQRRLLRGSVLLKATTVIRPTGYIYPSLVHM